MNKAQKCALFNLIVTVVLLALHGSAFAIIATVGPVPKILNAAGFFVAFALIGVSALLYQRKQRLSEADFDERDRLISKRALAIAYISLWAIVIAGCIASWVVIGPAGTLSIPACVLPVLAYGVFIIIMLVHSLAVLIQYGWKGKGESYE